MSAKSATASCNLRKFVGDDNPSRYKNWPYCNPPLIFANASACSWRAIVSRKAQDAISHENLAELIKAIKKKLGSKT